MASGTDLFLTVVVTLKSSNSLYRKLMLYSPPRSLSHLSASLIDTSLNDRVTR